MSGDFEFETNDLEENVKVGPLYETFFDSSGLTSRVCSPAYEVESFSTIENLGKIDIPRPRVKTVRNNSDHPTPRSQHPDQTQRPSVYSHRTDLEIKEKHERLRTLMQQQEMSECTFQPSVNKRTGRTWSWHQYLNASNRFLEERSAKIKKKQVEDEIKRAEAISEYGFTPQINPKSYQVLKRVKSTTRVKKHQSPEEHSFHPKINIYIKKATEPATEPATESATESATEPATESATENPPEKASYLTRNFLKRINAMKPAYKRPLTKKQGLIITSTLGFTSIENKDSLHAFERMWRTLSLHENITLSLLKHYLLCTLGHKPPKTFTDVQSLKLHQESATMLRNYLDTIHSRKPKKKPTAPNPTRTVTTPRIYERTQSYSARRDREHLALKAESLANELNECVFKPNIKTLQLPRSPRPSLQPAYDEYRLLLENEDSTRTETLYKFAELTRKRRNSLVEQRKQARTEEENCLFTPRLYKRVAAGDPGTSRGTDEVVRRMRKGRKKSELFKAMTERGILLNSPSAGEPAKRKPLSALAGNTKQGKHLSINLKRS